MRPKHDLPLSPAFTSVDTYISSLVNFYSSSELFKTLCGGVHVLDFFTSNPKLYTVVLPLTWQAFFDAHEIQDILDLLLREQCLAELSADHATSWRSKVAPPRDLIEYIQTIRNLCLCRDFVPASADYLKASAPMTGLKVKKSHEVEHIAVYVDRLAERVTARRGDTPDNVRLVDLGSGQGYLDRQLAREPYNRHVIGLESKLSNISVARQKDLAAVAETSGKRARADKHKALNTQSRKGDAKFVHPGLPENVPDNAGDALSTTCFPGGGSIQHVAHWLADGDLSKVIDQMDSHVSDTDSADGSMTDEKSRLLVMSLHSCGNLVHHGIRSLLINPSVDAVALLGCCYNLMTERLGPPTYKLPSLRRDHPRLVETTSQADPHGFPMSKRYCELSTPGGPGLRLNITARMMAVQAPQNWTEADSGSFFTRHFYRALLQKILLDLGLVTATDLGHESIGTCSPSGFSGGSEPVLIGSLGETCYVDFVSYVRGASAKLALQSGRGSSIHQALSELTDGDIRAYEIEFAHGKKQLSVLWSLMAFSAGVVEALIVVDRYLFLTEQTEVAEAWVEPVFDYSLSPRNLVVVGIKK